MRPTVRRGPNRPKRYLAVFPTGTPDRVIYAESLFRAASKGVKPTGKVSVAEHEVGWYRCRSSFIVAYVEGAP